MKKTTIVILLMSISPFSALSQDVFHQDSINTKNQTAYKIDTIQFSDSSYFFNYYKTSIDSAITSTWFANAQYELHGTAYMFANGRLSTISNFISGKKEGVEYSFSADQEFLEWQMQYENDTLNGQIVHFYPNGTIKTIGNCYWMINMNYGDWKEYYSDGTLKVEGKYGLIKLEDELIMENVISNPEFIDKTYLFYGRVKIGEWKYYFTDASLERTIHYSKPELD